MIDNSHLVYVGVIMLFLICTMIVAVAGMLVFTAGFAVAMAARIRKRRKRLKAAPSAPTEPDQDDVFPRISLEAKASHFRDGADGNGRGRRRENLPPVMNSVSLR